MEESHVDERESMLALHLGALYSSCPDLLLPQSSKSTCGVTSFSARCFLPEERQRSANSGSGVNPAASSLSADEYSSGNAASGPVREVFCRGLPHQPVYPASRTAALKTARRHDDGGGSVDTLSEALGPMYGGIHVAYSPQTSAIGAAGPEAHEEGGAAEGKAARPSSSTPRLVLCNRLHAGLIPLYTPVVDSADGTFLLFACLPFRLTALTQLCRELRGARGVRGRPSLHSVDLMVRFVFYQLLRAVDFLHSRGITVGNLGSSNILLTEHLWVQVAPSIPLLLGDGRKQPRHREGPTRRPFVATPRRPPGEDLPLTYRWVKGMVSNLEYLLAVNAAAGRVVGDRSCHPIVPWVCDFARKVTKQEGEEGEGGGEKEQEDGGGGGWRDLTMTKFRLKKGDAQLDKSYSEGKPPHHIPESLSELTLVVYLARQLPLQVLQDVVRSELVAEEYPKSLARMYSWTPDECIPEFYTEPGVFRSAHGGDIGLPDLDVPPWCDGSPKDFIRYHRSLLEGERVSRSLHRWLDITFGYCLKGQAAVDNKNVPLPPSGLSGVDIPAGFGAAGLKLSDKDRPAFVQIFRHPHPPRKLNARASASATNPASKPAATLSALSSAVATPTASRDGDDGLAMKDRAGGAVPAGGGSSGGGGGGARLEENDGAGAGEARASIFGVAFDDYIGEEGVLHPPPRAAAVGGGGGGGGGGCGGGAHFDGNNGGGAGEACATIEEDRRALAFAHNVELRLSPWYGRPRTCVADEPDPASPATKNAGVSLTGATWGGDYEDNGGAEKPSSWRNGHGDREKRQGRREMGVSLSTKKKNDLLACGCVLAEMCAGEPVFAGPSLSSSEGPSGVGGKSSWLEAAAELPPALRRAIRALTHPDPDKRPSAHDLLSTTEPTLHAPSSKTPLPSWRAGRAGRPHQAPPPPPAFRGLFPPYMRDVYAFLAAVHQEETAQKRLVLAAAALPVLQVPLHAFSLVVPYLVALLEEFSPKTKEADMRKKRNTSNSIGAAQGCATATVGASEALLRQERGGVSPRWEGKRRRPERLENLPASTGLSAPMEPPPPMEEGGSQPPRLVAAAAAAEATLEPRQSVTEESEASAQAEAPETEALEAAKHAAAWVSVFDLCAARLGPGLAAEVLLPSVLATLEGVQSSERANRLMDSNIWGVIARRVGNESFLRHAFPLLLGWLEQGVDPDICVGDDRHQCCVVQSALRQSDEAGVEEETQQATAASPRSGRPSAAAPMSGNVGQAEQPSARAIDGFDERGGGGLTAASRVQVAAAASVSSEIFGRLGPTLAARYLVPALVDCLGRLVTTAAAAAAAATAACHARHSKKPPTIWRCVSDSTTTAPTSPIAPERGGELDTNNNDGGIGEATAQPPPPRLVGATTEHRRSTSRENWDCRGDPVSIELLRYCRTRGATEEYPHVGVGGGTSFLILSRALGEMCLQIGTEEVTVPLVLSRLFHQILPNLAPVLAQRGGASASATGFRSVLEVTSLLGRLLPTLCPETISHFYVGMRPPASSAEAETTCSVPWLFLAMPLPPPVVGLDVPYSADARETSGDDSEASAEELEHSSNESTSSGKQGGSIGVFVTGNGGGIVGVGGIQRNKLAGSPETVADVSVRFVCHVEAARLLATTAMGVLGDDGDSSGEEKEGKEECARVLQAGEAFFAAFERSYCGLALSSSTMVAALKLARELHSPLASLFGFDVMHRCVPSSSGPTVAWLTEGAVRAKIPLATATAVATAPAPREGFDDLGAEESSAGVVILGERSGGKRGQEEEDRVTQLHSPNRSGLGSGALLISSWKPLRSANLRTAGNGETGADGSPFRPRENHQYNMVGPGRHIPLPPEDRIYISPPISPENVEQYLHSRGGFSGSTAAETVSGRAKDELGPSVAQPPLLNRARQAVKQQFIADGNDAPPSTSARIAGWLQPGRQAARTAASTLSYLSSRADRDQQQSQVSRTSAEGCGGTRSSAVEEVEVEVEVDGDRTSRETRSSPSRGGVPAWGHKPDKRDPLLVFPSSTLPPSSSRRNRGDGAVGERVRAPDQCGEQQSPQLSGAEWPEHRHGRSRSLGAAPPETVEAQGGDDSEPEEWPSLLGAIGSKTPSAPGPALLSLAERALSSPFSRPVPAPTAAATSFSSFAVDERGDFAASSRVCRETAEAVTTAVTSATKPGRQALSASPRRLSPFSRRGNNSALPPPPSLPPPLPLPPPALAALVSSGPPPPLPGTCRGVGVEVRARLRERALFTGTREWGESGRIPGGRRGHAPGEGFEPDAIGSLFPVSMAVQASFLAHRGKAAVTSLAVEKRSESILLTGSAEGEVRVWSLREHPVSRLSSFRSGDSGAGGGSGGSGGARSGPHAAITQLGIFEGAGRAAALDGVVRIWDVERSRGLAICHQGAQRDAPSLTAFSLSGCGDGTTPPLDESEWKEMSFGASGSFSAPDDQQLTASYGGGIVHFDCRQGRLGDAVGNLFPVAQWDIDARLQLLLAHPSSKGQIRGDHAHGSSSRRHGDAAPLPVGLCSVCEGEGAWLAAGSGAGQVVVFDKRRPGGRPLFWWNAHGGAVVGVFHVARDLLLTMSRDRTAVLWDLSRSRSAFSGVDSTAPGPALRRHPSWGAGAYTSEEGAEFLPLSGGGPEGGGESGYGECSPARVSTTFGLPNTAPGMCPATVAMLPLSRPPPPAKLAPGAAFEKGTTRGGGGVGSAAAAAAAGVSMFGEGFSARGNGGRTTGRAEQGEKLPVLFAASGDRMVASVVRREAGGSQGCGNEDEEEGLEEEVHPVRFVGPTGKTIDGKKGSGGMRSASGGGTLVVRSVAVLPLRRLSLLGCADGWVRVGT